MEIGGSQSHYAADPPWWIQEPENWEEAFLLTLYSVHKTNVRTHYCMEEGGGGQSTLLQSAIVYVYETSHAVQLASRQDASMGYIPSTIRSMERE